MGHVTRNRKIGLETIVGTNKQYHTTKFQIGRSRNDKGEAKKQKLTDGLTDIANPFYKVIGGDLKTEKSRQKTRTRNGD